MDDNSSPSPVQPAKMWQRGLAAGIDMALVISVFYYAANRWGAPLPNGSRGWHGWAAVAVLCAIACYWIVPEWLFGSTPGKFFCRIHLTSSLNTAATFGQALKRNLLRPVDFIFFYFIGFVVAMLNPLRQRLGDQWARTVVVRASSRR
jgi:uncharacterized RDD family membrane protein YckC